MIAGITGRRLALAIVALLIFVAAAPRLVAVPEAMTHVDDIGVAATILEARQAFRHVEDLRGALNNRQLRQYDSPKFRLLRSIDKAGMLGPTYDLLAVARDSLAVPARWTYAPGQYVVTGALVSEAASYREELVRGRAPSAIASMLAILVVAIVAWRLRRRDDYAAPLVATAVTATSLELLVFSAHMSNYALGVLASGLLLGLTALRPTPPRTWRGALALGGALWVLVMLSYQILPLVFAALAAVALAEATRETRGWRSLPAAFAQALASPWFRRLVAAGAVFVALMLPVYLVLLTSVRPITWNAGPNGEFVFDGLTREGGLLGAGRFLAGNAWLMFSAMTTPVPWAHPARAIVTGILAALFLVGVGRLLADRSRAGDRATGLFILIACGLTLVMSLADLTALSPTRHALVLLPLFAIAAGEGAALVLGRMGSGGSRLVLSFAMAGALTLLWATALPAMLAARRDPVREADLAARIATVRPAAILEFDHTYAVELMPSVRSRVPVFNEENLNFPWLGGRKPAANGPVIAVSTGGPLDAGRRRLLGEALARSEPGPLRWCPDAIAAVADLRPSSQTMEVFPIQTGGVNGYYAYVFPTCGPAGA